MTHIVWAEDARPHTIADCVLPNDLKSKLQRYVDDKEIPNLLFVGGPGIGKTSAAKAMCDEVGCDFMFINGSNERGIDMLRTKITGYASTTSFTGGRKVIIIDEADNLTPDCQKGLRSAIEEFEQNCTFIFTANSLSTIIPALQSRFAIIEFKFKSEDKTKMAAKFFKRVQKILDSREVKYEPQVVAEVIQKFFPDFRRALNQLQHYAKGGSIDVGLLSQISDVSIAEVVEFLKMKNFTGMRKWVGQNLEDTSRVYRRIYDEASRFLQPDSVPDAIMILSKYQYQAAFAADPEVQLAACLTELMITCRFS